MPYSKSAEELDRAAIVALVDQCVSTTPHEMHLELLKLGWPMDDPLRLAFRREVKEEERPALLDLWRHVVEESQNQIAIAVALDNISTYPHKERKELGVFEYSNLAIAAYRSLASSADIRADDQVEYLSDAVRLASKLQGQEQLGSELVNEVVLRFTTHARLAKASDSVANAELSADFPVIPLGDPEYEKAQLAASTRLQHHHASLFALRALQSRSKLVVPGVESLEDDFHVVMAASEHDTLLRARLWETWLDVVAHDRDVLARAQSGFIDFERERAGTLDKASEYGVLAMAEQRARAWGLTQMTLDLQMQIQNLELPLHRVDSEIRLPAGYFDSLVARVAGHREWTDSMIAFGVSLGPLTGSHERNLALAEESLDRQPLARTMRSLKVGSYNVLEAEADGQAQLVQAELGTVETRAAALRAQALLAAREQVADHISSVQADEISSFLQSAAVIALDETRANAIAVGLKRFFAGDFDESAHMLLPRIEFALRDRAASIDSIISPTDGTSRGGLRLLKQVLDALGPALPKDWVRSFESLLNEQYGLNLRNQVLHGFVPRVRDWEAALVASLMIAALLLPNTDEETHQA